MENIMKRDSVLPEDFDGTFRFTNWSDEDFIGKWNSKQYIFPKGTTSPILMNDQTPLEIQYIRKKFAKDLAEREFGKSQDFAHLKKQEVNGDGTARLNSIHQAGAWSIDQLAPYIQRCLEPLELAKAEVVAEKKAPLEDKLSRNDDGELNTQAIDTKVSLKKKALEG